MKGRPNLKEVKCSIKKSLLGKDKNELKGIIIGLVLKQKNLSQTRYIKESSCIFCGDSEDLQIHHIKPLVLKGDNSPKNLVTCCSYCHWYLHSNPKFKIYHSRLTKEGLSKSKNKDKIGKRGRDKKPRSARSDRGIPRIKKGEKQK